MKQVFNSAEILRYWDPNRKARVETDASGKALSGILSQLWEGNWHPIAYWSRKLTDTEQRWHAGQQELLTIIDNLKH